MGLLAVTVIGPDRPGIIADVTGRLAELEGNLEDSSMTILRGHFAMTLVVAVDVGAAAVDAALHDLTEQGGLAVEVREVGPEPAPAPAGGAYLMTVHGGDRPGIVSATTRVLAEAGANITDLTTRLAGELYLLVAEVDLPGAADLPGLSDRLHAVARDLGVEVSLRPADVDVL